MGLYPTYLLQWPWQCDHTCTGKLFQESRWIFPLCLSSGLAAPLWLPGPLAISSGSYKDWTAPGGGGISQAPPPAALLAPKGSGFLWVLWGPHTLLSQTAMRKLSTKTIQNPCSALVLQPVLSVQLFQACVLLSHNGSSREMLRSYSRPCVVVCIHVFPHLPIVLPDWPESTGEHRRRAGRDSAGGHTACGAGAAAGAV